MGAKYYAENPLYPLNKTLANINMDGFNQWGSTKDLVVIGLGNSTLDDVIQQEAAARSRTIMPDAEPEKGYFYRSDHFEFAKQGVPALYVDAGTEFIGKDEAFSKTKREEYTATDYHKPSDEIKPDWDLSGAVEDAQLMFQVGYRVSQRAAFPEWKPGTEFKQGSKAAEGAGIGGGIGRNTAGHCAKTSTIPTPVPQPPATLPIASLLVRSGSLRGRRLPDSCCR